MYVLSVQLGVSGVILMVNVLDVQKDIGIHIRVKNVSNVLTIALVVDGGLDLANGVNVDMNCMKDVVFL